jgi:hypothetical protein
VRSEKEDENVGTAGDGQGHRSRVEQRDDEDARHAAMQEPVDHDAAVRMAQRRWSREGHNGLDAVFRGQDAAGGEERARETELAGMRSGLAGENLPWRSNLI